MVAGDAPEAVIQRDLTYALLDAYHVPPGKFGLNRNTERMAGNLLISQQPIETYDLFIKKLIEYVNAVLEAAGSKLRYTQTISRAELDAIGGLLTVKAAKTPVFSGVQDRRGGSRRNKNYGAQHAEPRQARQKVGRPARRRTPQSQVVFLNTTCLE